MDYRLLGPLEVVRAGQPLELGPPKQRAVLAVLLLEAGRAVSTDRITSAVWGDDPPANVAASLQAYVSNLRRLLRDTATATSPIARRPPGYALEVAAEHIDARRFVADADTARAAGARCEWAVAADAASAALRLWRGPLLADLRDEEWVRVESAALDERRVECRETLVAALLGTRRLGAAIVEAQQLRAEYPLRERACWLYATALYQDGRAPDALALLREYMSSLDEELGLEPSPAIRDLYGAVLRQDPALSGWPAEKARTPGVVQPEAPFATAPQRADEVRSSSATPLVGRTRELAAIGELLAAAPGDLRWVVLSGTAGIGKTRLAEEVAARWSAGGGRVLRTGCPEDDGTPAWWPVRQLVRGLGADPDVLLTPPADVDADAARFAVYERLLELLPPPDAAEPVLLFVDDVQWADAASVRWLTHVAETVHDRSVALLLTVRDGREAPPLRRLLAAIARRTAARQLEVPPLAAPEVGRLASLVSGECIDDREGRELTARTGGNPFFVSEYARLPPEERNAGGIPVAVRSVLGRRLAGLDPGVLQVLRTAAVIGDEPDIDLLAAATRLARDELADLLDDAADERIIVTNSDSGRYAFAHGLLREELLAGISPVRRQRLHLRVAQSLAVSRHPDALVRRAAHLVAALPLADPADVVEACRAAAVEADQRWHSESAAHWWGAALKAFDALPAVERTEQRRDELLVAQVAALARAGRGQTVLDLVDACLVDAVHHGRASSAGRLASALLRTAGAWPWASYGDDPGPLLARLAGIEPLVAHEPAAHARVLAALAVGSYYDPDNSVPDRLSGRALNLAETLGDPDVLADAILARAGAFAGVASRVDESVALLDRLAALPHEQQQVDAVLGHNLRTLALLTLGDIAGVVEHQRAGAAGSDALRLPVNRVQLRWIEGTVAHWRGELDEAERLYEVAYQTHLRTELYLMGVQDLALIALRWEQGRLSEVGDLSRIFDALVPWARAVVCAARGELEPADRLITAELSSAGPELWTTLGQLTLLAHVVVDAGLPRHAPPLIDRLRPRSGLVANIGQIAAVGPVDLALARLLTCVGDPIGAQHYLQRAAELAQRAGGRCALLRCRLLAAQLDPATDATEYVAIAERAQAMGMLGVAEQARAAERAVSRGERQTSPSAVTGDSTQSAR